MKNKILISIITIVTFTISIYVRYIYAYAVFGIESWNAMDPLFRSMLISVFQFSAIMLACWIMIKQSPFNTLGLGTGAWHAFTRTLLFSLPMFIGYPLLSAFNSDLNLATVYSNIVSAGFFEEYMYRGFLFGVLFFYAGWGYILATLIASVIFACGHLYQAENIGQLFSVFTFTALANVGFILFYLCWKNLWVPVFLHAFMDLAWAMFNLEGGALGNAPANIFRFMTLGLTIFFTIRKMKENKVSLKGILWINKRYSNPQDITGYNPTGKYHL